MPIPAETQPQKPVSRPTKAVDTLKALPRRNPSLLLFLAITTLVGAFLIVILPTLSTAIALTIQFMNGGAVAYLVIGKAK